MVASLCLPAAGVNARPAANGAYSAAFFALASDAHRPRLYEIVKGEKCSKALSRRRAGETLAP